MKLKEIVTGIITLYHVSVYRQSVGELLFIIFFLQINAKFNAIAFINCRII